MLDMIFPSVFSLIVITAIGLFFGLMLSIAKIKLKVEKDPRFEIVLNTLPGANCGACGMPGCSGYAMKIVDEGAEINLCPVSDAEAVKKLAEIMGKEVEIQAPKTARVGCHGGNRYAKIKFDYSGPKSCQAAQQIMGGFRVCDYGCLGLGDCEASCPFDAIKINDRALPEVDFDKCTGCGNCVDACPRNIISLLDAKIKSHIQCKNREKGKVVRLGCAVGCTACRQCIKACKEVFKDNPDIETAINVDGFLAIIDYEKCIDCGKCAEACPQNVIAYDKVLISK